MMGIPETNKSLVPMSADTQSRQHSSDDDLFIPSQSYNSDDERFFDAMNSDGVSTEETSSKENDQHSEDERDGAVVLLVLRETLVSELPESIVMSKRRKKNRKSKSTKSKNSKTAKVKTPGKDTDLELLDALIAQNANTTWRESPIKQEVKAKISPFGGKKLKDILREKREAANSTVNKKIEHAIKFSKTQPDKVKKYMDNRSKVIEREDGTKTTMVKVTREALERFKLASTNNCDIVRGYADVDGHKVPIKTNIYANQPANVEHLLNKYEERVANGEMTIDEAIARATTEQDSSDDEEKLMADDDPMTKLINREQMVNLLMREKEVAKDFIDHTSNDVERCLADDTHLEVMINLRDFEKSLEDNELNHEAWLSMCKLVYARFSSKVILNKGVPITQPTKFYEEVLKQYVAQSMIQSITEMDQAGVFDRYDPKVKPLAVTCYQRHIADLFPKTEIVVEMSKLIANGFAPKDVSKLDVFGTPLVAYGIFWSFAFNFNLFGAFFRAADGGYNYYWVVYDRINEDIDCIVGLPRRIVKETVNIGADEKDGSNSVHIQRETISEQGLDGEVIKSPVGVELGSSAKLHDSMHVDAEAVLNPEFRQAYTEEVDRLTQGDSDMKVRMKYKEVPVDVGEIKEKLATDDIADISIESKPGEKRRICISFKSGASEDDKASLVHYVASVARGQ